MSSTELQVPEIVFIVPYRNREEHKMFFTKYMTFLLEDMPTEKYRIHFVHQCDNRPFNRGAMKNIGFLAIRNMYPTQYKNITLVFHDVDNPVIEEGDFYDDENSNDSLLSVEFYHEITNVNKSLVWVDVESGGGSRGGDGDGDVEVNSSSLSNADVIKLYFHPFVPLQQILMWDKSFLLLLPIFLATRG